MRSCLVCLLAVAATGCPDVTADPGEGSGLPTLDGPTVEFDPLAGILPFPNNLAMCVTGNDTTGAPCTIGKLAIPPSPCEPASAKATRLGVLNQLDGFGTFEGGMQVTFTEEVDAATLDGHVVMYQRTRDGLDLDPASAQPVPVVLIKGTTLRFTEGACTDPASVATVTVMPLVPLAQRSTYVVALTGGIETAGGVAYLPSTTWALVRQPDDPVTVDAGGHIASERTPLAPGSDANHNGVPDTTELLGLDQLWKAHAAGLGFLDGAGLTRSQLLVAWEVTTQTTTDALDATIAGSPAATVAATGFDGLQSLACTYNAASCPRGIDRTAAPYSLCPGGDTNTQCVLKITLGVAAGATGAAIYTTGNATCAQVGCAGIADILVGQITTANYQTALPNPLATGSAIPGAWTDPLAPTEQGTVQLEALVFIPATAAPSGAGYPTVVFGHGLTSSKEALYAFAPQLATKLHMAAIAIDFVDHGSRAIRISTTGACSGATLDPSALPQCFAPILSADLGQTRDNLRQTVLDLQRVVKVATFCGAHACTSATVSGTNQGVGSTFAVDPAHLVYVGQSLGGIVGSTATATSPNLVSALLDVPAVGWLDILEHTANLGIRCQLVDALITAQVLTGDLSTGATPLCATDAWQAQPGYQQFAGVARWILDPADGANFMPALVTKKLLIQEVVDDQVVPNFATDLLGTLAQLTPATADPAASATPTASLALTMNPTASKWLRYPTLPADTMGFPGNMFAHASLLRPANGALDGQLGTIRLQTDALTFLGANH